MKKEIIVEFSGGIDSLYVAYFLADKYEKIHLLTFDKGYLHFALGANKSNLKVLEEMFGADKYIYKRLPIKSLFKQMAVKTYRKTSKEYGNEVAWCIPCRASMAVMSIIYAVENNIPEFTDGANWEQAPDGEKILATADNYPEFLGTIAAFAREFKVHYTPLLYDLNTREERRAKLIQMGAKIDFNSLDRKKKSLADIFNRDFYKRTQPICLSGYLVHWKRNFFNVKESVTGSMVRESIQSKLENIAKPYIHRFFEEKNLSLEDLLIRRVSS